MDSISMMDGDIDVDEGEVGWDRGGLCLGLSGMELHCCSWVLYG